MTTTATSPTTRPTDRDGLALPDLVHTAIRRDLADFAAAAARTPLRDRWTWGRLQVRWRVFTELLQHAGAGDDRLVPLLTACEDGFRRLTAAGDHDVRAALVVRLTAVREGLRRQLAEAGAQPTAPAEDAWSTLDPRAAGTAGLGRRAAEALLPWALDGVDEDEARRLLATAPRALALRWRLTRRGFARERRRDFRYTR